MNKKLLEYNILTGYLRNSFGRLAFPDPRHLIPDTYHDTCKRFFLTGVTFLAMFLFVNVRINFAQPAPKVLILGFDGMDPVLLRKYMDEGIMPNFKSLAEKGSFKPLGTSMPPQSPVAWSNFITGMNPGGHGIFDFIARDPKNYLPYLSTSKTTEAKKNLRIGDWLIPFSKGETLLLRKGKAFWEILEDQGIPSTVLKVPANFPPVKSKSKTLSGMGTPDVLGTYGTFTFFTSENTDLHEEVTSGELVHVKLVNNVIKTRIKGPPHPFRADKSRLLIDLTVKIDPEHPVALLKLGDEEVILKEGDWSDWVKVRFEFPPLQEITGICRFYMMKIRSHFQLYVSPINIDPINPVVPVSTPVAYSGELAKNIGYFYTQGMPEDTKALDQDFLGKDDFLELSKYIKKKRIKMLEMELDRFESGLLFVYFPTTDPVQHMFWRNIDKNHPAYDPKEAGLYSQTIRKTYADMDIILADAMKKISNDTTVIIISDHGFGSFRRYFHMNKWLKENGYLNFADNSKQESGPFFENVDFNSTMAYALGFNGIYLNLRGREGMGIVSEEEKERLLQEIIIKLEKVTDPENGNRVINKVYKKEELYSGKYVNDGPDLLIGYDRGYRASWETALGKVPTDLLGDNKKKWSGTHLFDFKLVPGVLLSSRKIKKSSPALYDIAPTILDLFGLEESKEMVGKSIYR